MEDDEVLRISDTELRKYFVKKRLEKVCTCKNRTILIDTENRLLECSECGAILDAFDIVESLANKDDDYWWNLKALEQQKEDLIKWLANNRMGQALRNIASHIRQGLIPSCPHCNMPFDLERLNTWQSREYAEIKAKEIFRNKIKEEK